MRKLAFAAMLVGGLALAACGGGEGTPDSGINTGGDANTNADSGPSAACNPVSQTGCQSGEKCASVLVSESPVLTQTKCVPDGTVAAGGACTVGATGADTGYDDCVGGYDCSGGICVEICNNAPDSCADGFNCTLYEGLFNEFEGIGLCNPACDPVVQDCSNEAEGCYLALSTGKASCAGIPGPAQTITHGQTCYGPQPGSCYLNGCNKGFLPFQQTPDGSGDPICSALCRPLTTSVDTPGNAGGDAENELSCADRNATASQCHFINSMFSNTDHISSGIGVCVETENGWGDCTGHVIGGPIDQQVAGCQPVDEYQDPSALQGAGGKATRPALDEYQLQLIEMLDGQF